MIALLAAGLIGLMALTVGLAMQGRVPRMGVAVLAPLTFVVVSLLQSIPFRLRCGVSSIAPARP